MVQPAKFRSIEFEWDEHNLDEIAGHQVGYEEAEECFFNRHQVYRPMCAHSGHYGLGGLNL